MAAASESATVAVHRVHDVADDGGCSDDGGRRADDAAAAIVPAGRRTRAGFPFGIPKVFAVAGATGS